MIKLLRTSFFPLILSASLFCVAFCVSEASAQSREKLVNGSERETVAIGHFARARALLIEALAEFEKGKAISDPSLIIDTERWRGSIVLRAEELNRVVAPKPRITRQGISYGANSQLTGFDKPSAQKPLVFTPKAEPAADALPAAKTPVKQEQKAPVVQAAPAQKVEVIEEVIDNTNEKAADDEAVKQLADEIANIEMDSDSDFGSKKPEGATDSAVITGSSDSQDELQEVDIDSEVERILQESLGNSEK